MNERHRNTTIYSLTALERAVAGARGCLRAPRAQAAPEPDSFWHEIAATLPREVRDRHAAQFEAMARYEPLLDKLVSATGQALLFIGKSCRLLSHALRMAARRLDSVGRSLTFSR